MANFVSEIAVVGSREKANNRYGQNGFTGPSSDMPGKHTTSGFLPAITVPKDEWQTRKVDATPIKTSPGMQAQNSTIEFPKTTMRRAVEKPASKKR